MATRRKLIKQRTLLAAAGAVLVLAVVVTLGWHTFTRDDTTSKYTARPAAANVQRPGVEHAAADAVLKSYVAHVSRQYDTAPSLTMYDMYDSSSHAHVFRGFNGSGSIEVFSGEQTYYCNTSGCTKYQGPHPDNTRQYAYEVYPEVVARLKQRSTKQASEKCGDAMCSVWQMPVDDTTGTGFAEKLYINDVTGDVELRIRTYVQTGYIETISYDYRPVTISLPPTPTTLPQL